MVTAIDRLSYGITSLASLYLAYEEYTSGKFIIDLHKEVQEDFLPCFEKGDLTGTSDACRSVFNKIFCWAPYIHPEAYKWGNSPPIGIYKWFANIPPSYRFGVYGAIAVTAFVGIDFLHRTLSRPAHETKPPSLLDRVSAGFGSIFVGFISITSAYKQYLWNTKIVLITDMHNVCSVQQNPDINKCQEYLWRIQYFERCESLTYENALSEDQLESQFIYYAISGVLVVLTVDLLHRTFSGCFKKEKGV